MERFRELLRFDGRLSRVGYWRSNLTLLIAMEVIWCVALFAIMQLGSFAAVMFLPLLLMPVAAIAITVRRLHDRGKSAWWLAVFYGIPWIILFLVEGARPQSLGLALLFLALNLVSFLISIWATVEVGFRSGVPSPNAYGEIPPRGV